MTRTVQQVITQARGILQDERVPYRYSDTAMAGYVAEAIGEARRVRPDLFQGAWRHDLPWIGAANLADPIPLPDTYFVAMVNYVAGRTDLREDAFAQDGRAIMLIQAFGTALMGR